MKTPCLDCSERQIYCHTDCKKYKVYKYTTEENKRRRMLEKESESYIICNTLRIREKTRRN